MFLRLIIPAFVVILAGIMAVRWIGLRGNGQSFPAYPASTTLPDSMPLPPDLPAPVHRFYQTIIGNQIPIIHSAVLTLSGRLRFMGITFPARMRFTHEAGRNYRHYIEATVFGQPVMKVNESYLDGHGRMELPVGTIQDEPKIDAAANLGLWGESLWLPTIFITDPRVRWEAIDAQTARLIVPFADTGSDSFTVQFDAATGLIHSMETRRWRDAHDAAKLGWRIEPLDWTRWHGMLIPSTAAVTWLDEGTPWLVATADDVVYNADVSAYIRGRGL
ncbi:MAG: hypothetical protein CL610_30340 [Anaerolineaceae bacterium]|nr:hypothetical protein [Anaerolineaceae bacterium]